MNKKEQYENSNKGIKNIIEKYNTDKKYKAKIQLTAGFCFLFLLIIYINMSNTNMSTYGNITTIKNKSTQQTEKIKEEKEVNLLEKITDIYEYEIKITYKDNKEDNYKEIKYQGKSYKNNLEIIRENSEEKTNYFKVDSRYYKKNEEKYELINDEEVYNVIEKEQIELNNVKEYINLASLDHVTNYSSGKKEYVYHLKVKDVIKSYQETDEIEISVTEENDILTITFDYTNLIKVLSKEIKECKVESIYKNIGNVEEFQIIDDTINDDKE